MFQILSGTKFNLSGLRVDSNFWRRRLWGGRNTHTRAHQISALTSLRVSSKFRARVCVFRPPPQSPSPKLETTRSLQLIKL